MKEKIPTAIKQKAVEEIIEGKITQSEAAKRLGIGRTTVRSWLSKYRSEGRIGLENSSQNRIYSIQTKQQAVEAYLTGQYSQQQICEIFKIRSRKQLRDWLKVYNSGSTFKQMSGGSRMKSTHKATKEERVQIAKECLESGNRYGEIAKKYGVSYQQARTWTLKYKELGEAGLDDRRGQRKYEQEPRTELEKAQIRIAQLEHQLRIAEMENHLLKKLEEIERRESLGK